MHHLREFLHSARSDPLSQADTATSSVTNSTPQPKQINDSIYIWHDPPNPTTEIVFVHDINWKEYKQPHLETWIDDTTGICWPIDTLSVQYPEARILLAWYDAGAWKSVDGGHTRLFVVAENFRQDILPILTGRCPLLLVGHGFGGLVIKELVRSVQLKRDEAANALRVKESKLTEHLLQSCDGFLENMRGAFFFAPPSHGSSIVRATKSNVRGSLLKSLDLLDEHTAELNEWFRKWRGVTGCKVTVIGAALPTTIELPTRVAVWYKHLATPVLEKGPARFDNDDFYTSNTNYFNVCKLRDKNDSRFRKLVGLIEQLEWTPSDLVGYNRALSAVEITTRYQDRPQSSDLVGLWKMDEGYGHICSDSSRSRADGTISRLVRWQTPKAGGGLVFDGQSMVECGAAASLEGTTPFSISAWVKLPMAHSEDGVIIQQRGPTTYNGEYQLFVRHDGKPSFWVYGNESYQFELATDRVILPQDMLVADSVINDNQWHFVVAVRDATGGSIYVDGNKSGSATGIAKPLRLETKVFIGCDGRDGSDWLQGSLSDVRIYNRALSAVEITTRYQMRPQSRNLVGWWKMDEGSGHICSDSSRSRADGTISGLVTWQTPKAGGGLVFDGQSMVECGAAASLEGTTTFSISAWVKLPMAHSEDGVIIQQRGPTDYNGEYQLIVRHDGKPSFWVYGNESYQFELATDHVIPPHNMLVADSVINDSQWHFVVAVRDATGGSIYVDGNKSGSATGIAKPLRLETKVFIGYDGLDKSDWFQGSLSDVRIYNRALSAVEITIHYQDRPQSSDLVGWWKMDEGSGHICSDSSRSRAHGTISGLVTWQTPRAGGGLVFGGQSMVECGAAASLEGTTPFSISAWVKLPMAHSEDGVIIQQRDGTDCNGEYQLIVRHDGKPSFWVYGNESYQFELATDRVIPPNNMLVADSVINDSQWHFVVAVRDATGGSIYVDGNMSGSATGIAKPLRLETEVFIGCDGLDKSDWFQGSLSDVRIYNRALSAVEITTHYQDRPQSSDLVGWWKMDEGSGHICSDSSRSRADGTISRLVTWQTLKAGGGLVFDGQSMVECGAAASLEGTTPFSISAWVKLPMAHSEDGVIIQQRDGTDCNGEYQLIVRHDGKPSFWVYGNESYQFELATDRVIPPNNMLVADSVINDSQWHFVVAVRDATGGSIYVDGNMSGSATGIAKPLRLETKVFIGCDGRDGSDWLQGSLSDVRIYNRALSAVEITTRYQMRPQAFKS
ncbi:unnamed protein product [Calypogeia fissa]